MNLLRPPARFFGRQLFTQLSPLCLSITTHLATQALLKQIYCSPSASPRQRRFFKSISWITSSSAGTTSVSRKQDFCSCESTHKTSLLDGLHIQVQDVSIFFEPGFCLI